MATIPKILTLQEASTILNLSAEVIIQQAELGNLPRQLMGDRWQFIQSELEAWSERHDQRKVPLRQAGAFAHDETLTALQTEIDRQRQLHPLDAID